MTLYRKSLAQNPIICSASGNLGSTFHERSRKEKASFVPLKSGILFVWKCCEIQRKEKSRPATQTKPLPKPQSTWAWTIKINQQYVHVHISVHTRVCLKTFKDEIDTQTWQKAAPWGSRLQWTNQILSCHGILSSQRLRKKYSSWSAPTRITTRALLN